MCFCVFNQGDNKGEVRLDVITVLLLLTLTPPIFAMSCKPTNARTVEWSRPIDAFHVWFTLATRFRIRLTFINVWWSGIKKTLCKNSPVIRILNQSINYCKKTTTFFFITMRLPLHVAPTFLNPLLQLHRNEPGLFVHLELSGQRCDFLPGQFPFPKLATGIMYCMRNVWTESEGKK